MNSMAYTHPDCSVNRPDALVKLVDASPFREWIGGMKGGTGAWTSSLQIGSNHMALMPEGAGAALRCEQGSVFVKSDKVEWKRKPDTAPLSSPLVFRAKPRALVHPRTRDVSFLSDMIVQVAVDADRAAANRMLQSPHDAGQGSNV